MVGSADLLYFASNKFQNFKIILVYSPKCPSFSTIQSYDPDVAVSWSLPLEEENRLKLFENRVLRRIYGPKLDELTGEWREPHNEELNYMYCSPNNLRVIKLIRMRWAGHVEGTGERRGE